MSLATRISAFFLVALALVLAGFSGALYLLARFDGVRQLDDRLAHALDTLEASVDIEPVGLEWEPTDRQLTLGVDREAGAVRWAVRDGRGAPVDASSNARDGDFPRDWSPADPAGPADATRFGAVPGWRLAGRTLRLDRLLRQGRGHPDDEPGYEVQYPVLVLVVGLDPAPTRATLGRLALTLAGLSAGIWATAAALGRWVGRRALAPVREMAWAAAAMTAADLDKRLPTPATNDELTVLGRAFNGLLDRVHGAFDQLNAAYDRQRGFAGAASHQLRTPLAALLGQVQLALRRDRPAEEYRRVLALVQAEGGRLREIVESLLTLAEPGDDRGADAPLDLAAWAAEQLPRWEASGRAVRLEVAPPGARDLVARAAPALLAQVCDNLVENAAKYGDPAAPVVVRVARSGDSVAVSVADRGPGLAPDDLERVFEPFFRAESARRAGLPGVGLGLAVARRIAATLAGTLDAESEPGAGSRFILRLPAWPASETTTPGEGRLAPACVRDRS